jgi:DNA-binding beta-propeller fold protein YncE
MSNEYSNKMKKLSLLLFCFTLISVSCKKDKTPEETTTTPYDLRDGLWWVNEGALNGNNGSVDVITDDGRVARDAFRQSNGSGMGDVLQRVNVFGDQSVAVVNGSNQVIIMNTADMKTIRVIANLDYPRDAVIVGSNVYIAQGALGGKVGKYRLSDGALISELSVGQGPERLLENNGLLWVLNSGGWSVDNTISLIDLTSFTVSQTIPVHDRPLDIERDETTGKIMVLCSGDILYDANWNITGHTAAAIYWIDELNFDATYYELPVSGDHPRSISWSVARNELYLANQGIDAFDVQGNVLCSGCWSGDAYAVDTDNSGNVWVMSTPNFTSEGVMNKVNAANWQTVASYASGIGTSAVVDPR